MNVSEGFVMDEFRTKLRNHYSTLDIDTNNKETISQMIKKIRFCSKLIQVNYRPSDKKGFHFVLWCKVECDICRIVYDDFRRYNYDMNRPFWARNILFDKVIINGK